VGASREAVSHWEKNISNGTRTNANRDHRTKLSKAGQWLKEMAESGERDRGKGGDRRSPFRNGSVKLDDLGITEKQSSHWQKIYAMPDEDFEEAVILGKHGGDRRSGKADQGDNNTLERGSTNREGQVRKTGRQA
jgi:hypothetical protein